MEHETFVSGIGGQGVQLIAKTLAVAAMEAGCHVMLNGAYGGEMRGGKSLATVVVGLRPLRALPVTARASAAIVLHAKFWDEPRARLRADAFILADSEVADQLAPGPRQTLLAVPATPIARGLGNPLVGGMVLVSAYAAATGLATTAQLAAAMRSLVPAHRAQHLAANERAILAGAEAVQPLSHPVRLGDAVSEAA